MWIYALLIVFIMWNMNKIPSKVEHHNRNRYNIMPAGKLVRQNDDKYIDNNGIVWIKRSFMKSLYHNPNLNYTFESYDTNKITSSEAVANKKSFDAGIQIFEPGTFNYYSSFIYPVSHLFADILPIHLYSA